MAGLSGLCAGLVVGLIVVRSDGGHKAETDGNDKSTEVKVEHHVDSVTPTTAIKSNESADQERNKDQDKVAKITSPDLEKPDLEKNDDVQTQKTVPDWVLRFDVLPKKARELSTIRVNDELLDGYRYLIPRENSEAFEAKLTVDAIGYVGYKQSLSIEGNQTIVVNLVPKDTDNASTKKLIGKTDSKKKSLKNKNTSGKKPTKKNTDKPSGVKQNDKPENSGSSDSNKPKKKDPKGPGGLIDL